MGINSNKNTFCYYHAGPLSWSAGIAKCQANGGDYIVVSSLSDQVAYNSLLGSLTNSRGWIGLFQNTSSPNYSEPKGGWEWINGTTLTMMQQQILGLATKSGDQANLMMRAQKISPIFGINLIQENSIGMIIILLLDFIWKFL